VLDRQAEQGGTGGSGPQFIAKMSCYSKLFSSWPQFTRLIPCNRFLLFYNHPICTDETAVISLSVRNQQGGPACTQGNVRN
jgi:hypothetical protein